MLYIINSKDKDKNNKLSLYRLEGKGVIIMTETIGSRIKEVRKSLKMKQNELAEAIGVHFAMISLYESNKRTPSRETVEKMAPVLNVSADYLLCLSDHKTLDKEKSGKVTKEAADLMEKINKLSPEKRQAIMNLIDNF